MSPMNLKDATSRLNAKAPAVIASQTTQTDLSQTGQLTTQKTPKKADKTKGISTKG